jgi:hypothetical protein
LCEAPVFCEFVFEASGVSVYERQCVHECGKEEYEEEDDE